MICELPPGALADLPEDVAAKIDPLPSVTVGFGLSVYGEMAAITRVQTYLLLNSNHPVEKEDIRRRLIRDLDLADKKLWVMSTAMAAAAERFREYEKLHAAKPDPVKAERNGKMARLLETTATAVDVPETFFADLKTILDAADSFAQDWSSGLADGMYEEDHGLDELEDAIERMKGLVP